jgi:hypothetical protein
VITVADHGPVRVIAIDRHGLASIASGETAAGAAQFVAGAGRHGKHA